MPRTGGNVLVIARQVEDSVQIMIQGTPIHIKVLEIERYKNHRRVKLGFDAPTDFKITREELLTKTP